MKHIPAKTTLPSLPEEGEIMEQRASQARMTIYTAEEEQARAEELLSECTEAERDYVRLVVDKCVPPSTAANQVGLSYTHVADSRNVTAAINARASVRGHLLQNLEAMLPKHIHLDNLQRIKDAAMENKSFSAALGAEVASGKLVGHYEERREQPVNVDPTEMINKLLGAIDSARRTDAKTKTGTKPLQDIND